MIDLTGRTALVTGGSRGIGRACALRLAEAGANVIVNYVTSQAEALEAAETIRRLGRRAAIVRADVGEADDVAEMADFVRERFQRLDVLVSNAASGGFRDLMDATPRHFFETMNTNVQALLRLTQALRPLLERAEPSDDSSDGVSDDSSDGVSDGVADGVADTALRAKVIVMSSHGAARALPAYGLIGASKAALESLARHLALELGPRGVNVNVVVAGLVETDSTRRLPGAEAFFAAAQARMMLGRRRLAADDVADAVAFLASPLSDLIQGQTLVVDGGAAARA